MGRFVRPEAIEGTRAVTRVFDQVHVVHRACRTVDSADCNLDEARDRLRRLARVNHPHLAKLVAVGEESGRLMVVSEWLPGGQLGRSHIPNPGRLLPGVAEALYALHRHGLAHGGISAASFVLDGNNLVKLVDSCVREGSVPEDIEAFGAAMAALYEGRELPPELGQVARDAQEGRFGDATLLAQAVQAVCAALPPVATTEEGPPPVTAPVARPVEVEEDEERPLAFWVLLALLPSVLLLWLALLVGWWTRPVEVEAPLPAALHLAPPLVPVPVPVPPAPTSEVEPLEEEAHPPEPEVAPASGTVHPPLPAPYVEGMHVETAPVPGTSEPELLARVVLPPPAPVVPAPAGVDTGGWRKSELPGAQHPTVVLVLDAENTVSDRLGRRGRPRLEIRCANHRLSASLQPGVSAVEHVLNEVGFEATTALAKMSTDGGPSADLVLRMPDPDVALLTVPNPGSWVSRLAKTRSAELSYTPIASDAVVASFDTHGLDTFLGDLRAHCAL
jgi:hypothetical protein